MRVRNQCGTRFCEYEYNCQDDSENVLRKIFCRTSDMYFSSRVKRSIPANSQIDCIGVIAQIQMTEILMIGA